MKIRQKQSKRSQWQTSKSLARSAWNVLRLDINLIKIPILSAFFSLMAVLIAGLVIFLTSTFNLEAVNNDVDSMVGGPLVSSSWLAGVFYAIVYFALIFISTYFSAMLIAGLLQRFKGETPTLKSAFSVVKIHTLPLLWFSVLTGAVGYILQVIEEHVPLAGKISTWIAGAVWSVASMFAVPVIVSSSENVNPFSATRRSAEIIKKTWGETAILSIGIGFVSLISVIVYIAIIGLTGVLTAFILNATSASVVTAGVSYGVLGFVGFIGLVGVMLLLSMLSAVVKSAIFHYATTGETPEGFERDILRSSFTVKKATGVFAP